MPNIKYAIDSHGEFHKVETETDIYSILTAKQRATALRQLAVRIVPVYNVNGLDIDKDTLDEKVDYLFQPFGIHEYALSYVKIPLLSTSDEVKLAYYLKNDPAKAKLLRQNIRNGLKTDYTDDMLMSIVEEIIDNKHIWWFLNVLSVEIERNRFDGKIISAKVRNLIPYHTFKTAIEPKILYPKKGENPKTEENLNKFLVFSPEKHDILNEKEVIKAAMVCKDAEVISKICSTVAGMFSVLNQKIDEYSNIRSTYLNLIEGNKVDKIFPIYDEIKKFLLKTLEGVSSVVYKGSKITFSFGKNGLQTIYVFTDKEHGENTPCFAMNGHIYAGLESFQKALAEHKTSKCFEPVPWFFKAETKSDIITYYCASVNVK